MAILTGMKIIYNDIIPFKGYKAINLFGIVFARKSARPLSDKNKNHEAIHTAQMRELLYVPFYIVYLLDWVFHGFKYRRITFEQKHMPMKITLNTLKYENTTRNGRDDLHILG